MSATEAILYERQFHDIKMKPVRRKLYAYSGTPLPVEGQITVQVKCNGQTKTLPIVVVQADKYAPPLFGRDWLSVCNRAIFYQCRSG